MKKITKTIGLEIHIELATKSKMFCGCDATHFRVKPNTHTCPVCLGLPGALPVPNKKAIDWTIMVGLALNCKVNLKSKFDRKHYFYPDLPKGFQISQYDQPFCESGFINTSEGKVRITRVHLEEDTGKLIHRKVKGKDVSLVDFNRSGVPLLEIVTQPDISSAQQAKELAQKIKQIVKALGVSDCDMEKGSMRLEANTSLRKVKNENSKVKSELANYKVEVKNINSFKFMAKAIDYEFARQESLLSKGITPRQETRGWDEKKNITKSQRSKETSDDYRYFPEPDIPPFSFDQKYIDSLEQKLPKFPEDVSKDLVKEFGIKKSYAELLSADSDLTKFAVTSFKLAKKQDIPCDLVAGTIINDKIDITKTTPEKFVDEISEKTKSQITNEDQISEWVDDAMNQLPDAVSDYKRGKQNAISALIGKVMQLSKGKADAKLVSVVLRQKLQK